MGATQPRVRQGAGYKFIEVEGVVHSECAGCHQFFGPKDLRVPRLVDILAMELERENGQKIKGEGELTVADLRVFARCESCMRKPGVLGKHDKAIGFREGVEQVRKARHRAWAERQDDDVRDYMSEQVVRTTLFTGSPKRQGPHVVRPESKIVVAEQPEPAPFDVAKFVASKAELEHAIEHGRWPKGAMLGRGGQMVKKTEVQAQLAALEEERVHHERETTIARLADATGWRIGGKQNGKKK